MPCASTSPKLSLPKHRRHHSSFSPDENSRSSSIQKIWADDYFSDDQGQFVDIVTSPKPATLTERPYPRSIPLSYDEEPATPRQARAHQRSVTALLPSFRSPQRSPERSQRKRSDSDFMPTLTGDRNNQIRIGEKPKGLSGWFSGSSAPVSVGLPTSDFDEADMSEVQEGTLEASPVRLNRLAQCSTTASPVSPIQTTTTSRFGAFFTKAPKTVQLPAELASDLLNLDVKSALYQTPDSDVFSPAAFKNLQLNAEGLLSRMQAAYKSRTIQFHDISSEQAVQAEELEEANTRADALKMQLTDMASQLQEQDETIRMLMEELRREREAREEERIAREKSIEMVKSRSHLPIADSEPTFTTPLPRHRLRRSDSSFGEDTTDATDDDTHSESDSVFSRSMSPTLTDGSSVFGAPSTHGSRTPEIFHAKIVTMKHAGLDTATMVHGMQRKEAERPKMMRQQSTFEKVLKGVRPTDSTRRTENEEEYDGCNNCKGGTAAMAWDTVGLLKAENRGLKDRVEELSKAVEGALDLVGGLGLRV